MAKRPLILPLGFIFLCAIGAVVFEQQRGRNLRFEAARLERLWSDCVRLDEENGRFRTTLAEAGDLNLLRRRCADIERMRSEVQALELERRSLNKTLGPQVEAKWPPGVEVRRASEWTFRGQASPADAVESVLWSARLGDIDRLSELIGFDPNARQKADALFASLPEQARAQYGSPEKVIATLVAAQMPTNYSAVAAVKQSEPNPDVSLMTLRVEEGTGSQRDIDFKFQRDQNSWRLSVPQSAVNRYAALLQSSTSLK